MSGLISQEKKALLIGISDYGCSDSNNDSLWINIHGGNDVTLLKGTLQKQGFEIKTCMNKEAAASDIRLAMSDLVSSVKSGDIAYFHFSGHGQPVEDLSGDEDDGWDEAIIPVDAQMLYKEDGYHGENHILDDELNEFFLSLRRKLGKTGMLYVVLDACHMGSSYRGGDDEDEFQRGTRNAFSANGRLYRPKINTKGNYIINKEIGLSDICVLEACRSYQVNREIKQDGSYYGPLSFYVNAILKEHILSLDVNWIEDVIKSMNSDTRLIRQNMVVEKSK